MGIAMKYCHPIILCTVRLIYAYGISSNASDTTIRKEVTSYIIACVQHSTVRDGKVHIFLFDE